MQFWKFFTVVLCLTVVTFSTSRVFGQKRMHTNFFEATDYELNVYRIFGKEPGKTLLLIGGIQGDEPGGFLSADLYADFSLKKGNLIVVPRANFHSIVLKKRKINEDMNRKFADDEKSNYETKIVSILKKLIAESDCLLNLHDGSGFYSNKWEGPDRNPLRFGQSIIADCDIFESEKGTSINLGEMAGSVIEEINKGIENPRHYFHFNNHKTKAKDTAHKEQRKSATYYALYKCGIPAFGIETSKSLPLELKVRHHNLAINAFMKVLDIVPESPGIYLDPPVLRYLVVSINGSLPTLVGSQKTLYLNSGDSVMISHIETNYERGLSADIIGFGGINDIRKNIVITKPTRVVIRKDYYPCGSVYFALGSDRKGSNTIASESKNINVGGDFLFYKIKINGKEQICHNYEYVKLIRGDTFEIEDVATSMGDPSKLVVNFKGYVGDQINNSGEDRGYVINTSKDLWKRYSIKKDGKVYQIVVTKDEEEVGKLFVDLYDPTLKYLVLQTGEADKHCYVSGDTAMINGSKKLQLIDIITNVVQNDGIKIFLSGPGITKKIVKMNETVEMETLFGNGNKTLKPFRLDVKRDQYIMGSIYLQFFLGDTT